MRVRWEWEDGQTFEGPIYPEWLNENSDLVLLFTDQATRDRNGIIRLEVW